MKLLKWLGGCGQSSQPLFGGQQVPREAGASSRVVREAAEY
ncbi:hypothetical protein ACFTAO_12145 [Paenibacillus rhizoplanae]